MKLSVFIFAALLFETVVVAAVPKDWKAEKAPEIPKSIRVERDVTYLPADRREKADVYFPPSRSAGQLAPAMLLIHGGGFNDGDKARGREVQMGVELALHGYICM
ncbi:MAG: alpha/beta hydrolase, partial [Verrucomicrobia bacterium]|nr:alpha/beta hydrolase [Verrucomicrobiota bacterium]